MVVIEEEYRLTITPLLFEPTIYLLDTAGAANAFKGNDGAYPSSVKVR